MSVDTDQPIHDYFGLTYASWLTLPRVLLQEMPFEWQAKFTELLNEYHETFPTTAHMPIAPPSTT